MLENIENRDRANVLVQALPYIQKYYNKTVVIKYGGNAMINEELKDAVMTDIVLLSLSTPDFSRQSSWGTASWDS